MESNKELIELLISVDSLKFDAEEPFTWASGYNMPVYCDFRKLYTLPNHRRFLINLLADKVENSNILIGVPNSGIALASFLSVNTRAINGIFGNRTVYVLKEVIKADVASSIDSVVAVAPYGIPIGCHIAAKLELPFFYYRERKSHGMKKTLEGNPSVNISNPLIVSPTYLPPNLEGLFERYELFIFKTEDFFEELKSGNRRITVVEDVISTGNSLLEITKLIRETGFILHKILAAFTYDFEKTNTTLEQNNCPVYCGLRFPEVLSYLASNKLLPDHVLSTLHSWYESPFTWRCKE